MHLALITTSYPDNTPGSEAAGSFVEDFTLELAKHIKVTVIAPATESSTTHKQNLTIERFQVPRLPLSLLKPHKPSDWNAIYTTIANGKKTLSNIAKTQKIDHTFALWALPSGYWARCLLKEKGTPYSVWTLGSDIWSLGRIPIIKNIIRKILRDSQHCYSDGIKLKQDTETIAGRECSFLPSTRNIVLKKVKSLSSSAPYRLIFIGRWHPNKGIDILLESLFLLSQTDWKKISEVTICGGGPLEVLVQKKVDDLISRELPISLHGYVDKEKATQLLHKSDYLLLPSRIESIPVIFSDALQTKCPVIATPTGDLPRLIVEYNTGVLATEITPTSFSNAIKVALDTPPSSFANDLEKSKSLFSLKRSSEVFLQAIQKNTASLSKEKQCP